MSSYADITPRQLRIIDLERLRKNWGWFVALGIVLMILGALAIGWALVTTLVSVLFIGWLMIVGGVLQAGHAFWQGSWSSLFLDLFIGILYFVTGMVILVNPGVAAIALTLVIASFLLVGGIFRIAAAFALPTESRGWLLLNGVIAVILAILIWSEWPLSGLWVIGLFVGIDMILNGWSLVMLGIVAHRWPRQAMPTA
jgi:uncharacterized membrane protein HdeD (DUF308 family)